jgi:hypothetical protein
VLAAQGTRPPDSTDTPIQTSHPTKTYGQKIASDTLG